MAQPHALILVVQKNLVLEDGRFTLPESAYPEIGAAYAATFGSNDVIIATVELLRFAKWLDQEKQSPEAAGILLGFARAATPEVKKVSALQSKELVAQIDNAAKRFRDFAGQTREMHILEAGARPEGTISAGPLARFLVKKS